MKSPYQVIKEKYKLPPIKKLVKFWEKLENPILGKRPSGKGCYYCEYR